MELHKIRYFFTVIEHGNLSSAAQSLRVSQPTLRRQIRAIEEEYNTALFVRGGRGMMLTAAIAPAQDERCSRFDRADR